MSNDSVSSGLTRNPDTILFQDTSAFVGTNPSNAARLTSMSPLSRYRQLTPIHQFSFPHAAFMLDYTQRGYGIKEVQAVPALQENYEHRIRTRTSEYLEFFPVLR